MQFYIAIDGEKRGPLAIYRIIDQLRAGEISPDALGWEAGMDSWKKLRDIPAFAEAIDAIENPPEPEPEPEEAGAEKAVVIPDPRQAQPDKTGDRLPSEGVVARRPISRFCARIADYMLVSTLVLLFADVPTMPLPTGDTIDVKQFQALFEDYLQNPEYVSFVRLQYTTLFLWHLVEGVLLNLFGTTPGKFIFGIRVEGPEGVPRLPLLKSTGRAFLVWGAGFGLALFPFYLVGCGVALYMLLTQGTTIWDRLVGSRVKHLPMTPARILMAIGGFLLLMILSSLKFS
ncbi:MAG: RDD family protein [Verrucomicrobiae bacterium]|nr:RDD family protein [Verrucomicrobiae bacterium]